MPYATTNPATGVVEREFPSATSADVAAAISRAHSAHVEWREWSVTDRAKVLATVAALYDERKEELAEAIHILRQERTTRCVVIRSTVPGGV